MPANHAIDTAAPVYVPKAFPAALSSRAADIARLIPDHPYRLWGYDVLLNGEQLEIPVRLYFPSALMAGPEDDSLLLCLGTRHHDGYLRQKCVTQLLERGDEFAVPYIVQLLGEYVVEIAHVIYDALPSISIEPYRRFLTDNPLYLATARRRVISYWSCYYRATYPDLKSYPPYMALLHLSAQI
ncbi:hypothetical protein SAMN05216319_4228 [Duganella sp. CF402]|uniref:hypothetical protein n=1 Tax=unclassified Duganella TaxID=2636909 RepID=UPI0008B8FA82|nr:MULTISPECIES: hypothetical protein [unclassified Duganella]RZT03995.1 hypothetical protein EV582_4876 [Duganella sp. BK701]SEM52085.1 hypothetical protein SAMN05216319_4228 [Duganella sp. CF402]